MCVRHALARINLRSRLVSTQALQSQTARSNDKYLKPVYGGGAVIYEL